ncbi:MAG TPA: alpha/beta hydrolase [Anaerolineae bacterium]|nr:alpha/beta hydrolase [Anaerolineae bacterium]
MMDKIRHSARRVLRLVILGIFLIGCAAPATPTPAVAPTLPLEDCQLTAPGMAESIRARCGELSVPEDPDNPGGRQIALHVAVAPAVSRSPQPDPLFLLAGGPGQSAIEAYPVMLTAAFGIINQDRDVVLLDQRGTGKSNPLQCELHEDTLSDAEVTAALQTCPTTLDADARFYTTEMAVSDLEAMRIALGYDQINLYGASYGTRLAQAYLRRHPDRVRTLVLDAVVSPDFTIYASAGVDGAAALDKMFARCQADSACQSAFPDLQAEFTALLTRLEENPVEVSLANPITGEPLHFEMTRARFTRMVFALLYAPEVTALLPLSLHAAYADGNFAPLVTQATASDAGLYQGLLYAVVCTEDAPYVAPEEIAQSADTYFGDMSESLREVCATWPRGDVPADHTAPVTSNVPTLLLSGEADPITPPRYAEQVAQTLPNSEHLIAPGMGHGNIIRGCIPHLVSDLVKHASLDELEDVACVQAIAPPPFFVSFTGPTP